MNQKQIAEKFGIDVKTVRAWVEEGVLPEPRGRGGYNLGKCCESLATAFIAARREPPEPSPTVLDPKTRLEDLKVQKMEFQMAQERREYLPVQVLEHYAEKVGVIVHSAFEALPSQIKRRIPHLRGAEIRMIQSLLAKTANSIAAFDVEHEPETRK